MSSIEPIIANCTVCGHKLQFDKNTKKSENLFCAHCSSRYIFKDDYLNLLAPNIRHEICTNGILARKIKERLHLGGLSKNDHDIIKGIIASKYMARQYFRNVVHHTEAAWSARSYERFEEIFITNYLDSLLKKKTGNFC